MKIHVTRLAVLTCVIFSTACSLYAQTPVQFHYHVSMAQASSQRFRVTLDATGIQETMIDMKMPAWMPGYYQLINYAAALDSFTVTDGNNQPVPWAQTAASCWRIVHKAGAPLRITYSIKASKAFVAQPWLDTSHAYIAPTGVFLYADAYINHPVTVSLTPFSATQSAATGLPAEQHKTLTWRADNFDILYDSPFLIGKLEQLPAFTVSNIPHYFTGWQMGQFDRARFIQDLQKVVTTASGIIGHIPYSQYSFLAIGPGRGGIEHLNSTTISFSGEELNTPAGRQRMLSFIAHEYFHHYNVKRIRPIALGPFDYGHENRTSQLWVSEGLTVYYEYIILRRAGIMTDAQLLEQFQQLIASYENHTGHLHQTLAQASESTWSDGPFGRSPDSTISYYQKGPVIGLLLDFAIRHASANHHSLDDVMRTLYRRFYQHLGRGFTDAEFRAVCEETAGVPLGEIFDYVYTIKQPDYARYLSYAGLTIDQQPRPSGNGKSTASFQITSAPASTQPQKTILQSWLGN